MIKYEVIDNYLPDNVFKTLKHSIDNDEQDFPWYYNRFVDDSNKPSIDDHFYFAHVVYGGGKINSSFYECVVPLLDKIKPKAVIRVKVNGYPKIGDKVIKHRPHCDFPWEHKGAIFYLNTNNGKTVLADGTEIDSVANRMLFFDPSIPHNSTSCTDAKMRFNININYF